MRAGLSRIPNRRISATSRIDRGTSADGPSCHFVLAANSNSGFDTIITAAAHAAHQETHEAGLPTGVFQATMCPWADLARLLAACEAQPRVGEAAAE